MELSYFSLINFLIGLSSISYIKSDKLGIDKNIAFSLAEGNKLDTISHDIPHRFWQFSRRDNNIGSREEWPPHHPLPHEFPPDISGDFKDLEEDLLSNSAEERSEDYRGFRLPKLSQLLGLKREKKKKFKNKLKKQKSRTRSKGESREKKPHEKLSPAFISYGPIYGPPPPPPHLMAHAQGSYMAPTMQSPTTAAIHQTATSARTFNFPPPTYGSPIRLNSLKNSRGHPISNLFRNPQNNNQWQPINPAQRPTYGPPQKSTQRPRHNNNSNGWKDNRNNNNNVGWRENNDIEDSNTNYNNFQNDNRHENREQYNNEQNQRDIYNYDTWSQNNDNNNYNKQNQGNSYANNDNWENNNPRPNPPQPHGNNRSNYNERNNVHSTSPPRTHYGNRPQNNNLNTPPPQNHQRVENGRNMKFNDNMNQNSQNYNKKWQEQRYEAPMHYGPPMHNFGPPMSSYGQPPPIMGDKPINRYEPTQDMYRYPTHENNNNYRPSDTYGASSAENNCIHNKRPTPSSNLYQTPTRDFQNSQNKEYKKIDSNFEIVQSEEHEVPHRSNVNNRLDDNNSPSRPAPNFDTNYNSPGLSKNPKIVDFMPYSAQNYHEVPGKNLKPPKYRTLPDSLSEFKPDPEHEKYPKLTYDTIGKRMNKNNNIDYEPAQGRISASFAPLPKTELELKTEFLINKHSPFRAKL